MMPFCPAFLKWHALCYKSLSLRGIYGPKRKVMLVEDNEDCREILATMILLMGYDVILPDDDVAEETAR